MDQPINQSNSQRFIDLCLIYSIFDLAIAKRLQALGSPQLKQKHTPSIISTSRHALPQLKGLTDRNKVAKGAYILSEPFGPADLALIGAGAELNLAVSLAAALHEHHGLNVRIISFPCQRLFEKQSLEYKREVIQRNSGVPTIVIEAYAANGWERYADAAICMSTDRFGQSLPGATAYEFFGFEVKRMSQRVTAYLENLKKDPLLKTEFVEITQAELPSA